MGVRGVPRCKGCPWGAKGQPGVLKVLLMVLGGYGGCAEGVPRMLRVFMEGIQGCY